MTIRTPLLLISAALVLAACGGGSTAVQGDCQQRIVSGYLGSSDPSVAGAEADEGVDGTGDGGVGVGEGDGIGAGGSLGRFRNAGIRLIRLDNGDQVTGKTDALGLATLSTCPPDTAHRIEIFGIDGSDYFDEARNTYVPFPVGTTFSAQVPSRNRQFIGITPFTEAATRLDNNQISSDATVSASNETVAAILADQLPGSFRATSNDGHFEITGLPVALDDQTIDQAGAIPNNDRGLYSAANAGFSLLAGTFLPNDPTPALTAGQQLANDLSDGKLDLVNENGCSVATPSIGAPSDLPSTKASNLITKSCDGKVGDQLAYTYDSLWRASTVATSLIASHAGDQDLQALEAPIADYTTAVQKIIRADKCVTPQGEQCSAPIFPRSDIRQTVRLNSRGLMTIEREAAAQFDNGLGWLVENSPEMTVPGSYVDVRVGSEGQVVALQQDRRTLIYFPPLMPYVVKGDESTEGFARQELQDSIHLGSPQTQTVGQPVVSFAIPPARRISITNQELALFVVVFNDGSFAHVVDGLAIDHRQLSFPISAIAFDKFIPPGTDPSYGPTTESGTYPFFGPRRQYVLTRQGKVRVMLEGNTDSPGVELAIPGRVVQIAAESRVNIYALTSDGSVYWINADQADRPLHTVQEVSVPESMCWLARREAIACQTGNVYQWDELLRQIEFQPASTSTDATPSIAFAPRDIGNAIQVDLGGQRIWRLNSVDEFYLSSQSVGSFHSEGMRYLPVDADPFDPETTTTSVRNLRQSTCVFDRNNLETYPAPGLPRRYLEGWQIRRALKSVMQRLDQAPILFSSNGSHITQPVSETFPPIDSSFGFQARMSASTSTPISLRPPMLSAEDPNCQQSYEQSGYTVAGHSEPSGFSVTDFQLRTVIGVLNQSDQVSHRGDIPDFAIAGKIGERDTEFFLDYTAGTLFDLDASSNPILPPDTRPVSTPTELLTVWNDNAKYELDQSLGGWEYQYADPTGAVRDPVDILDPWGIVGSQEIPCDGRERCMFIYLVPRAVFDNPYQFRLCFDHEFNTRKSRTLRLNCSVHDFNGELVDVVMQEKWFYTPLIQTGVALSGSDIDFGFLLPRPN